MSKAFTLIELLVVISIIILMTSLTLPNYRYSDKQFALQRSAHKMAQSLRMIQEYAISAKEFNGQVPSGYGAYFDLAQPGSYILFADLDGGRTYSGANENVEVISLENNVVLSGLAPISPGSSLTVVFNPPDPDTFFSPDAALSVITLKASGTETISTQYAYYGYSSVWGWANPRAGCDTTDNAINCPDPFSASESDPLYVYDWYTILGFFNYSRIFEKRVSTIGTPPLQKIIEVNKAGLIAVE